MLDSHSDISCQARKIVMINWLTDHRGKISTKFIENLV